MNTHLKCLLLAVALLAFLIIPINNFKSDAKGQEYERATLVSSGSALETSEPTSAISSSEDGQQLYAIGNLSGDTEAYGEAYDGSLRLKGKIRGTVRGSSVYTARVENESKVSVWNSAGHLFNTFTTYSTDSIATERNGNVVVGSPTTQNFLHVYSPTGQLLRSFGTVKRLAGKDESQNSFLHRGKVLVDGDDNIYYVYKYVPLIQKFSPSGELKYETVVRGEAIDVQQEVAQRFLSSRKPQEVGGIEILTSAAIDRKTGHLWVSMNGSSRTGVLYEYNTQGEKLREYDLQTESPSAPPMKITGVRDIAITNSGVHVLTPQHQVLSFSADGYSFSFGGGSTPAIQKGRYSFVQATWSLMFAGFAPVRDSAGCPPSQAWDSCSYNCPGPACMTVNQPTTTSSTGVGLDCKAALSSSITTPFSLLSVNCTQNIPGTTGHLRGGCMSQVTTCKEGVNSTHSIVLECPAPPASACPAAVATTSSECQDAGMYWNFSQGSCQDTPWYCDNEPDCRSAGVWNFNTCRCDYPASPIVVDVTGNGFNLTENTNGVNFDLNADGHREQLSWTAAGSDDAWLSLDRNGNGKIENGAELFGNFTPQPEPPAGVEKNGFLALAEYDRVDNGGDGDGVITKRAAIFSSLRLWQDTNHNGISEPGELHTLKELGLKSIELDYKESKRTDGYGNQFRYRAKVKDTHDAQLGRWAWDVFLVGDQ